MSKILISGCGISFSGERPTWVKILKLCGCDLVDRTGPAISNQTILNELLTGLHQLEDVTHVVCQLTSNGKLDVELNQHNRSAMQSDSLRNFTHKGMWPSSVSQEHVAKQMYYRFLYSPGIEQRDTILKLLHLQSMCDHRGIRLLVLQGYELGYTDTLWHEVRLDRRFVIYDDYRASPQYQNHDHSGQNTVPHVSYQLRLASKINAEFLKMDLEDKLEKFRV